ncbi:hypothetical protein D3C85_1544790 [compost metagenome]
MNTPCCTFLQDFHQQRQGIETAREPSIGIELNQDLFALANRQPGFETVIERVVQTGHIADRHAGADRGNGLLPGG